MRVVSKSGDDSIVELRIELSVKQQSASQSQNPSQSTAANLQAIYVLPAWLKYASFPQSPFRIHSRAGDMTAAQ